LAKQHGKRKQAVFKVLKRLGIETAKLRSSDHRGQLIAYISSEDARIVSAELLSSMQADVGDEAELTSIEALADEQGIFYLVQLEPDHDPGRYKLGFAVIPFLILK
jgi:hypothetical protein